MLLWLARVAEKWERVFVHRRMNVARIPIEAQSGCGSSGRRERPLKACSAT